MLKRISILSLLLTVPALGACDEPSEPGPEPEPHGGKADSIDGDEDLSCPGDVFITRAANEVNNHVFTNCHNAANGRFVDRQCCADEIDKVSDISGCPSQTRFTTVADASQKRCINDVAGDVEHGQFVPTACCAALCSDSAGFDSNGSCRDGLGRFEEKICCLRSVALAEANCNGAGWEAIDGGTRDFACRASNGRFTFDACCVDQCAETISRTGQVPSSCSFDFDVASECAAGATPNAGGLCHDPGNGQFVKAACCELSGNTEDLDAETSDACWAGQKAC